MKGTPRPRDNQAVQRHHNQPKKNLDEWVDFPAHVHQVAYRMVDPPKDRDQSRIDFLQVLKTLNISEENSSVSKKFGYGARTEENGDRFVIVWEAHTEYYNYQIWHIPDDKTLPLDFGPIPLPDFEFPLTPSATPISSLDLIFSQERKLSPELIRQWLPGPHIYGSLVFGEDIGVVTSFTPDDNKRERYLIFSKKPKSLLRHLAKVADSVITIENYYHQLLLPFSEFSKAVDQIHQLELRHLEQRESIAAQLSTSDSQTMQDWVNQLTQDFLEVSRFAKTMRFQLSASGPYNAIVHGTVRGLQEQPLAPYLPLSEYVLGGITGVADGYQQLIRRIDGLESAFQEIISVIRTRVNLIQQEQNLNMEKQNLQLLANVDQTTKGQAILQHTVEGLSIIVIAYYLTGLGEYVLKALEESGIIKSSVSAMGIFVPVSLVVSFLLIFFGRKVIRKFMSSGKH